MLDRYDTMGFPVFVTWPLTLDIAYPPTSLEGMMLPWQALKINSGAFLILYKIF